MCCLVYGNFLMTTSNVLSLFCKKCIKTINTILMQITRKQSILRRNNMMEILKHHLLQQRRQTRHLLRFSSAQLNKQQVYHQYLKLRLRIHLMNITTLILMPMTMIQKYTHLWQTVFKNPTRFNKIRYKRSL